SNGCDIIAGKDFQTHVSIQHAADQGSGIRTQFILEFKANGSLAAPSIPELMDVGIDPAPCRAAKTLHVLAVAPFQPEAGNLPDVRRHRAGTGGGGDRLSQRMTAGAGKTGSAFQ